ncbi:SusD/RagB family nutrient-binding outer membrane lipoprotein [Puia sp.]|uniref:SusD/RagB family nutrient-binding outer membrane lipoprotein n=1 Tax=Puia sp. TaxID=2045100 RepID=UPI002F407E38
MRNKFSRSLLLLGATALTLFSSCKKTIDDAYLNPNAQVIQPVETLLAPVIDGFSYFYTANGSGYGLQLDGTLLGRYIQYWGTTTNGELYGQMGPVIGASDNTGSIWATVYYGQGQNVNKIIEWGSQQKKWDYVGVAWAIRAWGWLTLTNQYSDAPLVQAFNTSLSQFKYDAQPMFYDSCRTICYRALDFLSRTGDSVSPANLLKGDYYFYGGDVNKWKKFVYGLLARSFNDLSNKTEYASNHYVDSAIKYAALAMSANVDNAMCKFQGGTTSPVNSYYGPYRANLGTYRQGQYIADLMSGNNPQMFNGVPDPRTPYMLRENANGTYKGFIPWLGTSGLSTGDYPQNFWGDVAGNSLVAPKVNNSRYIFDDTAEYPMMTASEMQLILAESYLRKGDQASALTAYKNAIQLNMDMLTTTYPKNIPTAKVMTPTSEAAYLANPKVVPAVGSLTLSHIMLQKYIALYGWGVNETWTDMRRFHYIDADPITGNQVYANFVLPSGSNMYATNGGQPVYRCKPRYNSEYLYDVPELTRIGALNPNYNTYEMWFSQKN